MNNITKTAMITICGRPNVGKSSLTNALVGEKIAIVSDKPQTTRNRIYGVVNREDTQFVLLDTPGLHKPRSRLGDYMVKVVRESLQQVEAALLLVEPIPNVGGAERELIDRIKGMKVPAVLVINKIDTVEKAQLLAVMEAYSKVHDFTAIVPISAKRREGLEELAASIQELGVLQPLSVRRRDDGWELIAGERRLRAAKLAGLQTVPCLEMQVDKQDSAILALIENIQRRDLHYLEEATAIAAYLRQSGSTQEEAAALLGRSPSALANKLRLLRLSPDCCRLLTEHDLTERHARALLRLEDEEERLNALHHIIRQHLNVAQTERYIDKRLAQLQTTPPSGRRVFLLKDVRLFLNSLDRGLRLVREAGIGAESRREDTEDAILLTIRIPKNRRVG